jgi:hypothetical protein
MLLTQGGQRKQDFKGKVQIVARVAKDGAMTTMTIPTPGRGPGGAFEFRFYQRWRAFRHSGRLHAERRGCPGFGPSGGQVKLSRTINQL